MSLSPPRPRPAPLNALRAFEAAARLGGFSAAAEELAVTPGAVAQQVKALEAHLGAELFHRRAQGVALTPLGRRAAAEFGAGFDRLGRAMQAVRAAARPEEARIAALPAIAQLWLSPRLPAIRAAHPGAAISVVALERPPDLRREAFDMAIFFGPAPGAGKVIEGPEAEATPVCAPALAAGLRQEADLAEAPRLTDAAWAGDWARWAPDAPPAEGAVFSLYALAVEEAMNGAGVLIGRTPLIDRHLASGALVAPFARRAPLGEQLTVSLAASAGEAPLVEAVADALAAPWDGTRR